MTEAQQPRLSLWQTLLPRLREALAPKYEVLRILGQGGMAGVYLANEPRLNRKVAIKVISPGMAMDPEFVDRFEAEARTTAKLEHPNIVTLYEVDQRQDFLFIAMAYVPGRSLDQVMKEDRRALPIEVIQAWLYQIAGALGFAHRNGIIHRDVKPGNVLFHRDGRALVTDLGIAKGLDQRGLTRTGVLIGTPTYMSPEQCQGADLTGASDQYSLGVVTYELLTGVAPHTGPTLLVLQAHGHETPVPILERRPDCPSHVAAAVERMMAHRAEDRWPTIEVAAEAAGGAPVAHSSPVRPVLTALASQTVEIVVAEPPRTLRTGERAALNAVPVDAQGQPIADRAVRWRSDAPETVSISVEGVVSALAAGRGTLVASCGSAHHLIEVQVLPDGSIGEEAAGPASSNWTEFKAPDFQSSSDATLVVGPDELAEMAEPDWRASFQDLDVPAPAGSSDDWNATVVFGAQAPPSPPAPTGRTEPPPFLEPEGPSQTEPDRPAPPEMALDPDALAAPTAPIGGKTGIVGPAAADAPSPLLSESVPPPKAGPKPPAQRRAPARRSRGPVLAGLAVVGLVGAGVAIMKVRGRQPAPVILETQIEAPPPSPPAQEPLGRLRLGALPPEALVTALSEDGVVQPVSDGSELPPGAYHLEAAAPGYETASEEVQLASGTEYSWEPTLAALQSAGPAAPRPGRLRLSNLPAGASVLATGPDGRRLRVADGAALTPGTYQLEASAPGFQSARQRITVAGGADVAWGPQLQPEETSAPAAPAAGRLRLGAVPAGASVTATGPDGRPIVVRDGIELTPGTYRLEATASGYQTVRDQIAVPVGGEVTWRPEFRAVEPTPPPPEPARSGADPAAAKVAIEAAVGSFVRAFDEKATATVLPLFPAGDVRDGYQRLMGANASAWDFSLIDMADPQISGTEATVQFRARLSVTMMNATNNQETAFRGTLRQEGGTWRLVQVTPGE